MIHLAKSGKKNQIGLDEDVCTFPEHLLVMKTGEIAGVEVGKQTCLPASQKVRRWGRNRVPFSSQSLQYLPHGKSRQLPGLPVIN